ncbi:hypothetical protein BD309DRAFT_862230 [Dichomitus squalens]|uniref:uncharacterized protein n=1 Tax=Dichomitus squalens (strain LYAD-421) TaxID=732165 RepID=UPI0004411757|nr:uncharacterized protein DICSQDRAFT_154004 [Dichomitus squalens LYAD-421 SS1]EJF63502.1 hypothetical protein DICSQDRAFT_154004 [Dichomitus squalens LYAD-421 SS1]TBU44443.1 hypothetical protein BD309DRAFT_862230 [Dichomitus squalens]
MPSSFLPLSPSSSNLNAPFESVQTQLSSRKAAHRCPLKIKVQRTTIVDASSAGLGLTMQSPSYALGSTGSGRPLDAVRDMFTRSDVSHASSGSGRSRRSEKEREKASMHSSHAIGQGIVHSASRRSNSIVWSGAIVIPPSAEGFNGGFEINGLKVVDSIDLCIEPPPSLRSHYFPLHETVPLVLTSDTVKSRKGVPVSSLG